MPRNVLINGILLLSEIRVLPSAETSIGTDHHSLPRLKSYCYLRLLSNSKCIQGLWSDFIMLIDRLTTMNSTGGRLSLLPILNFLTILGKAHVVSRDMAPKYGNGCILPVPCAGRPPHLSLLGRGEKGKPALARGVGWGRCDRARLARLFGHDHCAHERHS